MTEERAKRKLAAIFSADVKGYSRLMADDEEATVRTINAYREVMTGLINGHSGRVVDAKGDNVLAEFPSVVDAVRCAFEVQKALKERNSELREERRMEFRIGINLGDVIQENETIYGDGVNVAARLEGLAEGGGICISGTAFDHVKNRVSVGYEYQGKQTVKNIPDPVRVYKLLMDPEAAGKVYSEEKSPRTKRRLAAAATAAVLAVVAGALIWDFYSRPDVEPASVEKMAFPLPNKPSIAVMPFRNINGDLRQEPFSDGLSESLMMSLSKVPQLFVIARHSTFSYKGKPLEVKQISEELGVQYVLEGGLQKEGDRIRVTVQLVDALKGHQLWAERYDREFRDLFALLDDITKKIITSLQVKLTFGQSARIFARGTENLQAYLKASEALWHITRGSKESLEEAKRLAEEAVALDPSFPTAHFVLGSQYMMDALTGFSQNPRESLEISSRMLKKAIDLDGDFAIARATLGYTLALLKHYDEAVAESEKAYALAPNSSQVLYLYGTVLLTVGRYDKAVAPLEEALRLEPIPPNSRLRSLGCVYGWGLGRYDKAIEYMRRAVQREPKDILSQIILTSLYSMANREGDARMTAEEVLRLNPKFSIDRYVDAISFTDSATMERVAQALLSAGLPEKPPLPLPDKPSIAVLPFVNMSGDPEQEYIADGITEQIITALARVPSLLVIASNSTFTFKGKPVMVQQVSRELGVRYVLEGSVQKSENRIRITAQLIDAIKGYHLWTEQYNSELKDLFALQDEITLKILTALEIKLTGGDTARYAGQATQNIDAYLKFMQGTDYLRRWNKDANAQARWLAKDAITLDPKYPAAYQLLGWTYYMDNHLGWSKSPRESLALALEAAQKAIALNDFYAPAHGLMGAIYMKLRQYEKAIAECERAIELQPNLAENYAYLSIPLHYMGRFEEAIAAAEKAIRLDPHPPTYFMLSLGANYFFVGKYNEAIEQFSKVLKRNPRDQLALVRRAAAFVQLGRIAEAQADIEGALKLSPDFSIEHVKKNWPYRNQKDLVQITDALRKAGLN